ncbi:ACP S-malonyltransferase [Paenibacillus sp. M1]|uniref:[acyl-carrier-protein] S-malonyltransferase n=1 Tax=Paenibacillus haidiansis TaxID=1574488 RepID=A0ABU7VSQ9_9BACL
MNDPKYSIVFPGREAFYKGLNRSFHDAFPLFRRIYKVASDSLKEDLFRISFVAPGERPDLHTVCLITYCYGIAAVLLSKSKHLSPSAVAGFSQGEFTASTFAGALSLPHVLGLVHRLEKLLLNHSHLINGSMARIVELDRGILEQCCRRIDPDRRAVCIAIYLSSDQNIISGAATEVEQVCRLAKASGARWAIPLNDGAYHSPLCRSIQMMSKPIFDEYRFCETSYPLYSCTDGKASTAGPEILKKLSVQIGMPVLWDTVVENFRKEVISHVFELGPGCTVSANSRLICPELRYMWINSPEDLNHAVEGLAELNKKPMRGH